MKYDFTTILERKGHDAIAYDNVGNIHWGFEPMAPDPEYDFIPMWVADMCFATAPAVTRAMEERLKYPTFGYFSYSDAYYDSIMNWQISRNKVKGLTREAIGYENGVHGLVNSAIEVLSSEGEGIFLHSPYYVAFEFDVTEHNRHCVFSELYLDEDGIWRMDYEDMDRKIKENKVRLAIFCSPHNPTGRVWSREEIVKAMEVFAANDCYVVSDEIWSDLIYEGSEHIPTQQVNEWAREHVIAAYAPSKTFNLAGLIGSYHIIYNEELRKKICTYEHNLSYNEMNVMSMHALIGAYSEEGADWVEELKEVLRDNCKYAYEFITGELPGVKTCMPEGTYMMYVDCTEYCEKTGRTIDEVIKNGWKVGVGWEDGRFFGGNCHIRLNLALPRSLEEEALRRMKELVFQ